jgi:hypothetical protein
VVQLLVAPHTSEIDRGKCDRALSILPNLDFILTPSIMIALSPDLPGVLLGQFSNVSQRVLPACELIGEAFGQLFRYFAERRPGAHLTENVLVHHAVRVEFGDVSVALFAQAARRQGLAIKSGLVEARFYLLRL